MSEHRLGNHSQSHTVIYQVKFSHLDSAEDRNPLSYWIPILLLLFLSVLKGDEGDYELPLNSWDPWAKPCRKLACIFSKLCMWCWLMAQVTWIHFSVKHARIMHTLHGPFPSLGNASVQPPASVYLSTGWSPNRMDGGHFCLSSWDTFHQTLNTTYAAKALSSIQLHKMNTSSSPGN